MRQRVTPSTVFLGRPFIILLALSPSVAILDSFKYPPVLSFSVVILNLFQYLLKDVVEVSTIT